MSDLGYMQSALSAARPRAVAALLRYFRDLDLAEEAFQEACLRALRVWPENGPPRDPASWLIMVGRNAALDSVRRASKQTSLAEAPASVIHGAATDTEAELVERLAHLTEKAEKILAILDELYPAPPIPLEHEDPFTLLVAVLLSAQTTDVAVNKVTPALFAEGPTPADMAALPVKQKASLGIGLAALLALIVAMTLWKSEGDYKVLYANLSDKDGGAVIAQLGHSSFQTTERHYLDKDRRHDASMRRVASALLSPRDELQSELAELNADEVRELLATIRSRRSAP